MFKSDCFAEALATSSTSDAAAPIVSFLLAAHVHKKSDKSKNTNCRNLSGEGGFADILGCQVGEKRPQLSLEIGMSPPSKSLHGTQPGKHYIVSSQGHNYL
jgi:hypothetical protein